MTPSNTTHAIDDNDRLFFKRIKQIPLGIAIIKGKRRIVKMANDKFLQIIGKTEHELIGSPLFDCLSDEEELMGSIIDGVLNNEFPHYFEEVSTFITKNGKSKEFFLDYEYTPWLNNDKDTTGVMVTLNDATEKVEARKKIENAQESTRLATEIGEIATWELNLQTHGMEHSESLATIFGYPKTARLSLSQILGHIDTDDLVNKVDPAFVVAMQTSIYRYEARMLKLKGERAWIRSHGKIFFDDNGEPLKMIGT